MSFSNLSSSPTFKIIFQETLGSTQLNCLSSMSILQQMSELINTRQTFQKYVLPQSKTYFSFYVARPQNLVSLYRDLLKILAVSQVQNSKEQSDPNRVSGRWTKLRLPAQMAKDPFQSYFWELFFFFKKLLCTKEYIPLCQGGLRSSLFKGAPQGRLIFPQMAMIISDSPKVNPFFQKGTRSWCKCRLEPIMPLCSLRWLNYGGPCFPRTLPKHWEACALLSREQDG